MIIRPEEFDYGWFCKIPFQKRKRGNKGTSAKATYKDIITAFDIETTRLAEIDQSIMYVWQWQFGDAFTVIGRTWDELAKLCANLNHCMKNDEFLVIYVHNLSYEFQFLRAIHEWETDEVFAIKSRKILRTQWDHLEYRCSYIHCNMGLGTYLKKMGAEHQKLSGKDFDYNKRRFPWTPLTDEELEYCVNDVRGLVEALTIEMKTDGDNLYTIPATSTGYVRRDVRESMANCNKNYIRRQLGNIDLYTLLHQAMRGGNTHANRYFAGDTVYNVHSADRSSSYPDTQCNCEFPVSSFRYESDKSVERLTTLIRKQHRAVLFTASFTNIRLRDEQWPCPYISHSKCLLAAGYELDNGRILRADLVKMTMTDIDFEILYSEYNWDDMVIETMLSARYGKLPKEMTGVIIDYYVKKTKLKGDKTQKVFYEKTKNKLNGIYGMSAQDPVKHSVKFDNSIKEQFYIDNSMSEKELLSKSNRKAFMPYQWGVWTTAWARLRLEEGIRLAGHNFIYCDTDSVKYIGEIDWSKYNKARIADSIASGAHATDSKGEEHYMGVFEDEGVYEEFRTMGAKKYVTVKNGKLEVTIAGVAKEDGGKELGDIENFKMGFKFSVAGGTESVYNDKWYGEYDTEEGKLIITPNVCIRPSTYTLSESEDYFALLQRLSAGNSIGDKYYM